jgi:Tol biopolymer transport system component
MINLQTEERTTLPGPWDFVAPPDSPPDVLAAQALIDAGDRIWGWDHLPLVPSHDNQWLAGWRRNENGWDLMLYDRYGHRNSRSLFTFWGIGAGSPVSWAPDNEYVLFDALPPEGEVSTLRDSRNHELWLVDILTGKARRLTISVTNESGPDLSPDGMQIVYSSAVDDFPHNGLYIMELATGKSRVVKRDLYVSQPSWSPNGQWIAAIGSGGIWILRPDGTDAQIVAVGGSGLDPEDVDWLP